MLQDGHKLAAVLFIGFIGEPEQVADEDLMMLADLIGQDCPTPPAWPAAPDLVPGRSASRLRAQSCSARSLPARDC